MNGGGTRFEARELACIRGERPVFRSLSFALEPGGGQILRGPNGSGKTTLLRHILSNRCNLLSEKPKFGSSFPHKT